MQPTNPGASGRMTVLSVAPSHLGLGVSGLSHLAAGHMQSGRVYALDAEVPSIRFPLISSCLANALNAGMPCSLVLRAKPEHYLEHLDESGKFDIGDALSRRLLNVFVMQEDFSKKLFQVGPKRMLAELSRFGAHSGSFVLFEHAGELLNMYDQTSAADQLDAISDWCASQGVTALLAFSGTQLRNAIPPQALLDGMAGMARLYQDIEGLTISFPYWRANGLLTSGLSTRLQLSPQGDYMAVPISRPVESAVPAQPVWESVPATIVHAVDEPAAPASPVQPRVAPQAAAGMSVQSMPVRDYEGRHRQPLSEFSARVHRLNLKAQRTEGDEFADETH